MATKKKATIPDADKALMETRMKTREELLRIRSIERRMADAERSLDQSLDGDFSPASMIAGRGLFGQTRIGTTLIDPEWLKKLPPFSDRQKAEAKKRAVDENPWDGSQDIAETKEEPVGYNGEWFQGPVPDIYSGALSADYTGKWGQSRLSDERKRVYCYEADEWGQLLRKFVGQFDSEVMAQWVVAARNGRLVGRNNSEALAHATESIASLRARLEEANRYVVQQVAIAQDLKNQTARHAHEIAALQEELERAKNIAKVAEFGMAKAERKVAEMHRELNIRKNARLAEIKDAGTRKLRLRAKE